MTKKSEKCREQEAIAREVVRTGGLLRNIGRGLFETVKNIDEILLLQYGIEYERYPYTKVKSMELETKGIDIKKYEEARKNLLEAIKVYNNKINNITTDLEAHHRELAENL